MERVIFRSGEVSQDPPEETVQEGKWRSGSLCRHLAVRFLLAPSLHFLVFHVNTLQLWTAVTPHNEASAFHCFYVI